MRPLKWSQTCANFQVKLIEKPYPNTSIVNSVGNEHCRQDRKPMLGLGDKQSQSHRFQTLSQSQPVNAMAFPTVLQAFFFNEPEGFAKCKDHVDGSSVMVSPILAPVGLDEQGIKIPTSARSLAGFQNLYRSVMKKSPVLSRAELPRIFELQSNWHQLPIRQSKPGHRPAKSLCPRRLWHRVRGRILRFPQRVEEHPLMSRRER
jgi:hypothetical protein